MALGCMFTQGMARLGHCEVCPTGTACALSEGLCCLQVFTALFSKKALRCTCLTGETLCYITRTPHPQGFHSQKHTTSVEVHMHYRGDTPPDSCMLLNHALRSMQAPRPKLDTA